MGLRSFGKVTVAAGGTPTRVTNNQAAPLRSILVQSLMIQALPGNTGIITVSVNDTSASPGDQRATLAKAVAVLPAPTSATLGPFGSVSVSIPTVPAGTDPIDASKVWIDASVNGEGVVISAIDGAPNS